MTKHTLTARIALFLTLAALAPLAAQSGEGTASFSTDYVVANYDGVRVENGKTRGELKYTDDVSLKDEELFGNLDGDEVINKPHELIAATAVLNIKEVVPADALKVYVEIAMEGAANSFLGVTGTTHGQVLERLKAKYNFTQKEITDTIRQTVAAAVEEEFSTVSFMIDRKYNAVLSCNPKTGQYTLSYEDVNDVVKEITATSLADLRAKMTGSRDFTADGINYTINERAPIIPIAVYAEWKQKGMLNGIDAIDLIKKTVSDFFIDPNKANYEALIGIYARYYAGRREPFYERAFISFSGVLLTLSEQIRDNISDYVLRSPNHTALARLPNGDSRYNVFSVPMGMGDGGGR